MNHTQILKRAWSILWSYKALWVFGIILALTSGFGSINGNNSRYTFNLEDGEWPFKLQKDYSMEFKELGQLLEKTFSQTTVTTWIGIAIGLVTLLLILFVLFRMGYYVSQTALIRMVNGYEESGEKVTWKQGFRWGWSKAAWRLFLINLVIYLPLALIVIVFFGCALLPIIIGTQHGGEPSLPGIIASIGLFFMTAFGMIVVGIALSMFMPLIRRLSVLQGSGVGEAIRGGWHMVRSNLKDVFLMWIILVGVSIGYFIAILPLVFLLIGVGAVSGGGIGYLVYSTIAASASELTRVLTAIGLGMTLFFIVLAVPLSFVGGLRETFISTTWTLTYRELSLMEGPEENLLIEAESPKPDEAETPQPA